MTLRRTGQPITATASVPNIPTFECFGAPEAAEALARREQVHVREAVPRGGRFVMEFPVRRKAVELADAATAWMNAREVAQRRAEWPEEL